MYISLDYKHFFLSNHYQNTHNLLYFKFCIAFNTVYHIHKSSFMSASQKSYLFLIEEMRVRVHFESLRKCNYHCNSEPKVY